MRRRAIALILVLSVLLSLLTHLTVFAATTIITQDEAINWLYSVEGTRVSTPYGYEGECASLGYRYYEKLLGYEVRANKGGTGNGKDYDDDNHSINLGWSRNTITSSTVLQRGDIVVNNDGEYGHVAIYMSGSPSSARLMEQGWSGFNGYTTHSSGRNTVGWTYVRPIWKTTTAPQNTTISIGKKLYYAGENITFHFESKYAEQYQLGVYYNEQRIITTDRMTAKEFTTNFTNPGHYRAYISAFNSYGYNDSYSVEFDVYKTPPSDVWIKTNKSSYELNEEVIFTCGAENATLYTIGINRNGQRICTEDIQTMCKKTFSGSGEYVAYISAFNHYGYVDSNTVEFNVYDTPPENAWIKTDKTSYELNEEVIFTCGAENATLYTIGINRNGQRICTEDIQTMCKKTFSESGEYIAYISAFNSYGFIDSAKIKFTVNTPSVKVQSTADNTQSKCAILSNIKNLSQSAKYTATMYNKDGVLLETDTFNISANTSSAGTSLTKHTDAEYIKVFLWDSNIKPIVNAEVIPLK